MAPSTLPLGLLLALLASVPCHAYSTGAEDRVDKIRIQRQRMTLAHNIVDSHPEAARIIMADAGEEYHKLVDNNDGEFFEELR